MLTLRVTRDGRTIDLPLSTQTTPILSTEWRDEITPNLSEADKLRLDAFVADHYLWEVIHYAYTDGQCTADACDEIEWAMLLDGELADHGRIADHLNPEV